MPKKKQLYDVCLFVKQGLVYRHQGTIHYNIPFSMARYYAKTLPKPTSKSFYLPIKNRSTK